MSIPTPTTKKAVSPAQGLLNAAWPYLTGKRGVLVLGGAAIFVAGALNWSWLVTIGAASVIIAILPCAVMCALGLCMRKAGGKSCSSDEKSLTKEENIKREPGSDV